MLRSGRRLTGKAGAGLAYLSADGTALHAALQPPVDAWRSRRFRQWQSAQDADWLRAQARRVVVDKIASMIVSTDHFQRHNRAASACGAALPELRRLSAAAASAAGQDVLMGLEGTASRLWFAVLGAALPEVWTLPGRVKRPPTDPVNALLSLGYSLLARRVESAATAWGLDPALGCLHAYRSGRPSLACDLMESFRIPAVDRLMVSQLEQGRFAPADFVQTPANGVRLTEEAMKRWLMDLEGRLFEERESGGS